MAVDVDEQKTRQLWQAEMQRGRRAMVRAEKLNHVDVQPDTSELHPKGDWWGDLRLPEFKLDWRDDAGRMHPLRVVGRYLECELHQNPLVRQLTVTGGSADCSVMAKAWHDCFVPLDLRPVSGMIELGEENSIFVRVGTTMICTLAERLKVSSSYAAYLLRQLPQLAEDPSYVDEADQNGVDHLLWAQLRQANLTKLARPGLIVRKGEDDEATAGLHPYLQYSQAKATPFSDEVVDKLLEVSRRWNLFGCFAYLERYQSDVNKLEVAYVGSVLDLLNDEEMLGKYIARIHTAEAGGPLASGSEKDIGLEFGYHPEREAYLQAGVPCWFVARDIEQRIPWEAAQFWLQRGIEDSDEVGLAVALERENPDLEPGQIAFWAQCRWLTKAQVLGKEKLGIDNHRPSVNEDWLPPKWARVKSDWWQAAVDVEAESVTL